MCGMIKFETINKVFEKLNIDYPSSKILSSLRKLGLDSIKFFEILKEEMGDELSSFIIFNVRKLNSLTSDGLFIDLSKYFGPGSFITIKISNPVVTKWRFADENIIVADVEVTSSRFVWDDGAKTWEETLEGDDDLGSMNEVVEFQEQVKSIIESELQRYTGLPFDIDLN